MKKLLHLPTIQLASDKFLFHEQGRQDEGFAYTIPVDKINALKITQSIQGRLTGRWMAEIINVLLVFDYNSVTQDINDNPASIKISSNDSKGNTICVNDLLNQDPRVDEDAMDNESNRKILTACISCMKHSEYGNLMPIPVDKGGNRLATDAYGRALEPEKLIYIYSNDDAEEVYTAKESSTGRPDPMPDYEVIICNNVLGYAYKYVGDKWVDTYRGITDARAQELANDYNAEILMNALVYDNKYYEKG